MEIRKEINRKKFIYSEKYDVLLDLYDKRYVIEAVLVGLFAVIVFFMLGKDFPEFYWFVGYMLVFICLAVVGFKKLNKTLKTKAYILEKVIEYKHLFSHKNDTELVEKCSELLVVTSKVSSGIQHDFIGIFNNLDRIEPLYVLKEEYLVKLREIVSIRLEDATNYFNLMVEKEKLDELNKEKMVAYLREIAKSKHNEYVPQYSYLQQLSEDIIKDNESYQYKSFEELKNKYIKINAKSKSNIEIIK